MIKVRQNFYAPEVPDVIEAVHQTINVGFDRTNSSSCEWNRFSYITTKRFFEKTAFHKGYANALTSLVTDVVKFPMFFETPKLAVKAAIKTAAVVDYGNARIVRIKNTLQVKELYISECLLEEAIQNEKVEILGISEVINWS